MSAENSETHLFTRDELKAKYVVQREIILRLSEDPTSNESKGKWIAEYGQDFSDVFNRRMRDEPDFIEKCISNKDQVVEELVEEVKEFHRQRLERAG